MDSEALASPGGPEDACRHPVSPCPSPTFRVTSGVHRGATFAPSDDLLLIGADTACDICLSDAGLASRHAAIVAQGSRIAIRCLEGTVSVNGQPLVKQGSLVLTNGAEILLGESGVRLHFAGPEDPAATRGEREHKPRVRRRLPGVTAVAVLAGLAALIFAGRQIQASRPDSASEDVVSTREAHPEMSEAELVAQVQDVFRTSGYDAQISYVGKGELRVENLDANHERVKRAMERVKADVPQLVSLSFAPPGDSQPPEHVPPFASAGVDHMTVSVNGSTGYLAADDGARYFVGSVLPGGLTVRRFTDGAVQVDRDGQIAWYRF
jgi:hypothetical protein